MTEDKPARRAGRRERMAKRQRPPEFNPAPPGQTGGQYQPLTVADMQAIFEAALDLLETLGMGQVPDRLADLYLKAGGSHVHDDRVSVPRALVHDAITQANKRFPLHGRDPARSIEVGGDAVHFGTGGAAC
ncbi:MAG: trimethylamine methyltransferase family protein, partial [Paracoccaceae bacterium]